MNRYHLLGNQNDLIEKLSLLFTKGKPVTNFPDSYKGLDDRESMEKAFTLIRRALPEEAEVMFQDKLFISAILFNFEPYIDPVVQIHSKNNAVIHITIGSMFTFSYQRVMSDKHK